MGNSEFFQIVLRGTRNSPSGAMGNFAEGEFFLLSGNLARSYNDYSNLFSKLKRTFCKYWTSIKIKISMTCVYKEYEIKIKMVQQQ